MKLLGLAAESATKLEHAPQRFGRFRHFVGGFSRECPRENAEFSWNKEVVNDSKVVAKAFEAKNMGPGGIERRVQKDVNCWKKKDFC